MDDKQLYQAKVSTRTKLLHLKTIRQKLSLKPERLSLFKSTVFGDWLNIKTHFHDNHLLHYLLQHQREVPNHDINTPFYFDIGQHKLEFGRKEMCLILGFRFGDVSLSHCYKRHSGFGKRILKILRESLHVKTSTIKTEHLLKILDDPAEFGDLTNDDAVRVCLLIILENVFMGRQERCVISNDILVLVDDFYAWNAFPWGEYIWVEFHNKIYNAVIKVRERHMTEFASKGPGYVATYTLCGFAFALKVWILETYPNATNWWVKDDSVIPRAIAWEDGPKFDNTDYDLLFCNNPRVRLMPTDVEKNQLWWSASLDFLGRFMPSGSLNDEPPSPDMNTPEANTSGSRPKMTPRKSCSVIHTRILRSTHIRTEVRKVVETVMPQVYEQMPSSATVASQIADMQQQINGLHSVLAHLKPDGFTHMPNTNADIPSTSVSSQMACMQQQINGLHKFLQEIMTNGVRRLNDGPSDTARAFVDKESTKNDDNMESTQNDDNMDQDSKSTGIYLMGFDINTNQNVQEDVSSSAKDLSTQEVQEVVDNLVGSPEYPAGCEDEKLVESSEDVSVKELTNDDQQVPVMNDEDEKLSPFNQDDQHVAMDESMNEPQKSNTPFEPDVTVLNNDQDVVMDELVSEPERSESLFNPSTGSMGVDINVHEDVLSAPIDLSTQEVQEVVDKLGGLPDQYVPMKEWLNDEMVNDPHISDSPFNPDILLFDNEQGVPVNEQGVPVNDMMSTPQNLQPAFSPVISSPVHMVDVQTFDCEAKSVKTVRVPFEREKKASKVFQSPYMQQPSTTQIVVRKRRKRYVPNVTPKVIGQDGKEIPLKPWKENLKRAVLATMFKAFVHPEIKGFLDEQKKIRKEEDKQLFRFPWGSGGTVANPQFWVGLLARDPKCRGWLNDSHICLFVDLMMHFRPANADWVMVGPFFCTMILEHELPLCYADGITNGIPWFQEGIEKVFFPINQPDVHWSLGELTISTGVITLYDSLGSPKDQNLSPWQRNFRQIFQTQLPIYLIKSEVMERRNMDPTSYHVSFHYATNVPKQAGPNGDCGVWVIIFLNRLSQNKPLNFKDPIQAALAYREHLAEFYWKYKIPVLKGFTK